MENEYNFLNFRGFSCFASLSIIASEERTILVRLKIELKKLTIHWNFRGGSSYMFSSWGKFIFKVGGRREQSETELLVLTFERDTCPFLLSMFSLLMVMTNSMLKHLIFVCSYLFMYIFSFICSGNCFESWKRVKLNTTILKLGSPSDSMEE